MSTINLESPFVSYTLEPEEVLSSQILGEMNRQMLQNLLFQVTMEKINLEWIPGNEKREAVLTGKIEILREILNNHDIASIEITQQAKQTRGHPTTMQDGVPIHSIFSSPGIRMPDGEIIKPEDNPDSAS